MKSFAVLVVVSVCLGVAVACGGGGSSGGGAAASQPSSSGSTAKAVKASLCAPGVKLAFDYSKAAKVKDGDGKAIGADGASRLVQDVADTDSFCALAVSPDTQQVLDQAHALVQQGKKKEALALIDVETTRVIALPTAGIIQSGARGATLSATDKADQKTRDLVALGGGAQEAGDDGARQIAEAQATYGPKLEARLQNADWQEAIEIAGEAEKLGLEDLATRAKAKAKSEIVKMGDAARKNFDQCLATDAKLKQLVTLLALAQLMDVGAAAEATITSVISDTAAANTLLHTNKLPPECARWNFKLKTEGELQGNGGSWTDTSTWTGTFQVGKDGKVAGTGTGLWTVSAWTCIKGDVGTFQPGNGTLTFTIDGQMKDGIFYLHASAKAKVSPEGCLIEDALAAIVDEDVLAGALDFLGEGNEDTAIVIRAEDGAVVTRQEADIGISVKVTLTITKRQGAGN